MNIKAKNNRNKTIKLLERKSSDGDVEATLQLSEYFEDGKYVEENYLTAVKYQKKAVEQFKSQLLSVSELDLFNFRAIVDARIVFCNNYAGNSNLTVLLGSNGVGKTTVLESISKGFSWLIRRIISPSTKGTGESIDDSDINNRESVEYSSIVLKFQIARDKFYKLELSKAKQGSISSRTNQVLNISGLAKLYKLSDKYLDDFNFPLLAFYSVERSIPIEQKDVNKSSENVERKNWEKLDGYSKSLNGKADFKLFFHWFKYLDDIKNATQNESVSFSSSIDTLNEELNSALFDEQTWESKSQIEIDILNNLKIEKKQQIEELERKLKKISEITNFNPRKTLDNVRKVIEIFMPEFRNLRIQRRPQLDLLVDKNGLELSVSQLSQGEKTLLGLIADIARRLVLLNPSLENPLSGTGVVLIDEIDLHLHPRWQQDVLPNLKSAFPNLQFIVSTHSPQVVTTCKKEELRIISKEEGSNIEIDLPKENPYGQNSIDALALMETPARPSLHIHNLVSEYEQIVREGKEESTEAAQLFETIRGQGFNIPDSDIKLWRFLSKKGREDG